MAEAVTRRHRRLWLTVRFGAFFILLVASPERSTVFTEPVARQPPASSIASSVVATPLGRNDTLERELRPGEAHAYEIDLESHRYVRLAIDQRYYDVAVRCFGPDGRVLAEVDYHEHGPESVSLISRTSGKHRFEVRTADNLTTVHSYAIKIEALRDVEPADDAWLTAEQLSTEAKRHIAGGSADALREARERYEKALPLWRNVRHRFGELNSAAQLGIIAATLGDPRKGLELYGQALTGFRAIGDRVAEARTLANIAAAYSAMGDKSRAIAEYEQAVKVAQSAGDRLGEGISRTNLAAVHFSLGNPMLALRQVDEALPIWQKLGDRHWTGTALNAMAGAQGVLGESQRAIELFRRAVDLWRAVPNRIGEAIGTLNIGTIYFRLGDARRALGYQEEAARLLIELGDRRSASSALVNVGKSYEELGEPIRALERYEQALAYARAVTDRRAEAIALIGIGHVHVSQGAQDRAQETYEQALQHIRTVGDRLNDVVLMNALGDLFFARRDWKSAARYYTQALPLVRDVGDRNGEAASELNVARTDRIEGRLAEARSHLDRALEIVEAMRGRISSPELRASFLGAKRGVYDAYVELLMHQHAESPLAGFDAQAFQVAERARARSLLDLLVESRAEIRQGVDPALVEREKALQQGINAKAQRQIALLSNKQTEAQAAPLTKDLETLLDEYQELQARIRATSPRYAALTQPIPLSAAEIREQIVDPDTSLLEYALEDEHSYAWVVTSDGLHSAQLPPRREIESIAQRFYEQLTARTSIDANAAARVRAPWREDEAAAREAEALSRMILWPVSAHLKTRRVLIVADGALQYVPFAALPLPVASGAGASTNSVSTSEAEPWFVARHEIVTLPSASTLAILRRELANRRPAPRAVAIFADPVFHRDDPRVRRNDPRQTSRGPVTNSNETTAEEPPDVERSSRAVGITIDNGRLPRLPFTRREADGILAHVAPGMAFRAFDFAANRATATSPTLQQYRVIHIATHGLLNAVHPDLSGVVLSLVDERGQPQDGFLRLHDIYNLNLPADLVVLSACQTGLGRDVKGEGLVGLTRGFMYAGAARVVVSLWKVDDTATAALMSRFYAAMFGPKPLSPAAALRHAQLDLARNTRWRSPYYWAGFVLQGEYR